MPGPAAERNLYYPSHSSIHPLVISTSIRLAAQAHIDIRVAVSQLPYQTRTLASFLRMHGLQMTRLRGASIMQAYLQRLRGRSFPGIGRGNGNCAEGQEISCRNMSSVFVVRGHWTDRPLDISSKGTRNRHMYAHIGPVTDGRSVSDTSGSLKLEVSVL